MVKKGLVDAQKLSPLSYQFNLLLKLPGTLGFVLACFIEFTISEDVLHIPVTHSGNNFLHKVRTSQSLCLVTQKIGE